jgi:hypothetical protein
MAQLTVVLPAARDRCGRAVLVSGRGDLLFGPFRVLGTASRHVSRRHGNAAHDRLMPFGDPPCGRYLVVGFLPPGSVHPRRPGRFGKVGALVAQAESGEALEAAAHGRLQMVLHGGPDGRSGRLRRTRGGLRAGDGDLMDLFAVVNRVQAEGDPVTILEIKDVARVTVPGGKVRPARGRRLRRARRARPSKGGDSGVPQKASLAALALFGVSRTTPTRRRFLAGALLAVGGLLLPACDRPGVYAPYDCDPAVQACDGGGEYASGGGTG